MLLLPETIPAERAYELGLYTELVPAEKLAERAREVAEKLAAGPTVAYASIKESVAYGASHTLAETLEVEDEMQQRCAAAPDHREAVEAFLAKRPPVFTGQR